MSICCPRFWAICHMVCKNALTTRMTRLHHCYGLCAIWSASLRLHGLLSIHLQGCHLSMINNSDSCKRALSFWNGKHFHCVSVWMLAREKHLISIFAISVKSQNIFFLIIYTTSEWKWLRIFLKTLESFASLLSLSLSTPLQRLSCSFFCNASPTMAFY